jgi:four helix bundle protein
MAVIKRFEDFEIWQLARELSKNTHFLIKNTEKLSKDFSLKDQMKRSSGSVMDNIAEGFGRGGNKEFIMFLSISNGSNQEYKSQLYRCLDYEYIDKIVFDEYYELADKIGKKMTSFIQYLSQSNYKGEKYRKNKSTNLVEEPFVVYETFED